MSLADRIAIKAQSTTPYPIVRPVDLSGTGKVTFDFYVTELRIVCDSATNINIDTEKETDQTIPCAPYDVYPVIVKAIDPTKCSATLQNATTVVACGFPFEDVSAVA